MTFLVKILLALAIASPTLAIPSKVVYVDPKPRVEESVQIPLALLEIAKCESGSNQYDKDGNVIRGVVNPLDTGKYQINTYYWGEEARKLNYDLETEEGNTKMAVWIYKNYGAQPWRWSAKCHGQY